MRTVSVGFIGAGFAAGLHAEGLAKVRGVQTRLAGVASTRPESASAFAKHHKIPTVYRDYRELLSDPSIDVVSICVPNALHAPIAIEAANAGKHVICEKPLTGAFGTSTMTGPARARDEYERAMQSVEDVSAAIVKNGVLFLYAENWIYAPSTSKTTQLLELSGGAILDIRAEESHSGSHALRSRRRESAGGGSLLMLGSHPIGVALHLKSVEAKLQGIPAGRVATVTAQTASLYASEAVKRSSSHNWIVSDWEDVETWANTVLTFTDGSVATITASFAMLGGVRNSFEVYTTNAVFHANMTPNDGLEVFTPDADAFGNAYLHEKVESRTGWISASPDEDWVRGYPQEMQDFAECIAVGRQPVSGMQLARDVVQVVYESYLSAEEGRRIESRSYPVEDTHRRAASH
ncbi:MAG: hypothetical protein JWP85_144 [Rhodoglobus sp.]|nr:hypothetical protein [Rhodoglobus sp.]